MLDQPNVGVVGCAYHPLVWDKNGCFRTLPKPNQPVESESVQGAFFGIKKAVLDKVGGFDENFKFAHYEETDLCFRVMKLGLKCIWFPLEHEHDFTKSATIMHGYKLCDEIQNKNEFRVNSEKNRKLLLEKHKEFFNKK
jgi:hypothetical protein